MRFNFHISSSNVSNVLGYKTLIRKLLSRRVNRKKNQPSAGGVKTIRLLTLLTRRSISFLPAGGHPAPASHLGRIFGSRSSHRLPMAPMPDPQPFPGPTSHSRTTPTPTRHPGAQHAHPHHLLRATLHAQSSRLRSRSRSLPTLTLTFPRCFSAPRPRPEHVA